MNRFGRLAVRRGYSEQFLSFFGFGRTVFTSESLSLLYKRQPDVAD